MDEILKRLMHGNVWYKRTHIRKCFIFNRLIHASSSKIFDSGRWFESIPSLTITWSEVSR